MSERNWQSVTIFLCWAQGLYFAIFGLWPLIHIDSFQAVTGEKTDHLVTGRESDHWLVYTVALLITVIGIVLLAAAWRRQVAWEIALLGFASAAALASIDVLYVIRRTIARIYLADAAAEIVFIVGWIIVAVGRSRSR